MSPRLRQIVIALALAGFLSVLFSELGRQLDMRGGLLPGDPVVKSRSAPARPAPRRPRLEELPCFACHNIRRYRSGSGAQAGERSAVAGRAAFPHALHREEGVGHCHSCHAITGHFQMRVRKDTCAQCHDADEIR